MSHKRDFDAAAGPQKGEAMKTTRLYPALALVLGAVCCALRRRQLNMDFDELRLPVPGFATFWLIALTAAALVLFALLMLPLKKGLKDWSAALGEEALLPLRGGAVLYLLAMAALILGRRSAMEGSAVFDALTMVVPVLMIVMVLPAAVGIWLGSGGGGERGKYLVLPLNFSCFWMLDACRAHAVDPVELHFAWMLLGVVVGALAWYELTALALERGHARRAFYLSLVEIVLSMTVLGGGESLADQLLMFGQFVCCLTVSVALSKRL